MASSFSQAFPQASPKLLQESGPLPWNSPCEGEFGQSSASLGSLLLHASMLDTPSSTSTAPASSSKSTSVPEAVVGDSTARERHQAHWRARDEAACRGRNAHHRRVLARGSTAAAASGCGGDDLPRDKSHKEGGIGVAGALLDGLVPRTVSRNELDAIMMAALLRMKLLDVGADMQPPKCRSRRNHVRARASGGGQHDSLHLVPHRAVDLNRTIVVGAEPANEGGATFNRIFAELKDLNSAVGHIRSGLDEAVVIGGVAARGRLSHGIKRLKQESRSTSRIVRGDAPSCPQNHMQEGGWGAFLGASGAIVIPGAGGMDGCARVVFGCDAVHGPCAGGGGQGAGPRGGCSTIATREEREGDTTMFYTALQEVPC